uniref:CAP-Gly domain-containing protein n=1 Tax=Pseudo-nitzschia australis TaxID=44445 RepID=A0A7S4AS60_9STRA
MQPQQCCQETNNNNAAPSGVDESSVAAISLGDRCLVQPGSRRGTVSYKGTVPELDDDANASANANANDSCSYWVGVTFDEPVGKTDGSATHRRTGAKKLYFEAPQNYASFVRGKNVEVGDFPELDLFDSDDDDDDDDDDSSNDGEDEL